MNNNKIASSLLAELKEEAQVTRSILAVVPFDQLSYQPHPKSMTLQRLATHVAEINGWWKECLVNDELDFAKSEFKPKVFETNDDLLAFHDDLVHKAEQILNNTSDEEFQKMWTMRNGNIIYFSRPKYEVVRSWCMNHLFHHRAQLGVYLRMLDIPLPGVYGPTADSQDM